MKLGFLMLMLICGAPARGADPELRSPEQIEIPAVTWGAHVSILNTPFPSYGAFGPSVMFFDAVRLSAGIGILESFFSTGINLNNYFLWGATLTGRMPSWRLSPVLGVGFSQVFLDGDKRKFIIFKSLPSSTHTIVQYLNPFAGAEYRLDEFYFMGAGLQIEVRLTDRKMRIPGHGQIFCTETCVVPLAPWIYAGFNFL